MSKEPQLRLKVAANQPPSTSAEEFDAAQAISMLTAESDDKKFVVRQKIAEGGMGEVYRAFDKHLQRTNVIKVIRPETTQTREELAEFIEEARITGRLEHPNIIPVHGVGVLEGHGLYFSMKEIVGESLESILQAIRRGEDQRGLPALLVIFRRVCDAIAFAHSRQVIHRDIKPDNVMVGQYGEVLVVDWGLARDLRRTAADGVAAEVQAMAKIIGPPADTQDNEIKGSPAFMAPEQARGDNHLVDNRTDVFQLGALLYTLTTLTTPYPQTGLDRVLELAAACDFENPITRAPRREIPGELCRIILRAMAADRDDRYQTVDQLIEDLDDFVEGHTASEERVFIPGETLIEEGEAGHEAYVIVSGRAEVYKTVHGRKIPLVMLKEGDVFGELALISRAARSATVRAMTQCHVVVITEALIRQGLNRLPSWFSGSVQALVGRLRDLSEQVHPLVHMDCSGHVMAQLLMMSQTVSVPQRDEQTGRWRLGLDLQATIKEIGSALCLDEARVHHVIDGLLAGGIVRSADGRWMTIPNIRVFGEFLQFWRQQNGQEQAPMHVPEMQMRQDVNSGEVIVVSPEPLEALLQDRDADDEGEWFLEIMDALIESCLARPSSRG